MPPTSLRSITATVWPAAVSLPASGGPAWPAPTMIASNFCAAVAIQMTDGEATTSESADDRDGVLDKRGRQVVSAVGGDEPLARFGTAERADDGADQTPHRWPRR